MGAGGVGAKAVGIDGKGLATAGQRTIGPWSEVAAVTTKGPMGMPTKWARCTSPPESPHAIRGTEGWNATHSAELGRMRVACSVPEATSHSLTVRSLLVVASQVPSGLIAHAHRKSVWPMRVERRRAVLCRSDEAGSTPVLRGLPRSSVSDDTELRALISHDRAMTKLVEVVVGIIGLGALIFFGMMSYRQAEESADLAERLEGLEERRSETEMLQERVQGFASEYFSLTCHEKVDMIDFPLERWFNAKDVDRGRVEDDCDNGTGTVFVVKEISIGRMTRANNLLISAELRFDDNPGPSGDGTHDQDGITYVQVKLVQDPDNSDGWLVKAIHEVVEKTAPA